MREPEFSVIASYLRRYSSFLSDYNGARTHNHLVCKQTLNRLAKLAMSLRCIHSETYA